LKINQEFKINIGNAAIEDKIKEQTGQVIEDPLEIGADGGN
jgi:hypothetical protein